MTPIRRREKIFAVVFNVDIIYEESDVDIYEKICLASLNERSFELVILRKS